MKAVYSEPVHRTPAICAMCYDTFPDCDCVSCMKPTTKAVDVLEFCVGVNHDRANIIFSDGSVKNVAVDTLRLIT